jgi:ligand-binding sensor domain-containing protein/signal transduction histidine kinase
MPIRRTAPFAWPLLFFLFAALSAVAAPSDSPFIVESWSAENGLPDNEAISILQTRDGYLWIGTPHGLVRFDGNKFTVFNEMNTPALKSDSVIFLYEDSQTNLWLGSQASGLAVIQNGKVKSFTSQTANAGPISYAAEVSGGILFYTKNGIASYHDGRMDYHAYDNSLQLYLLAQHALVPSRDGGLWQLWNGVIQKFAGNHLEKNFGPWPWKRPVSAVGEDLKGNLIVGTLGEGVFWFDAKGNYQHISETEGLSSDDVLSLCPDSEGDLWVGTDGRGLDCIKRKIFNVTPGLHPWTVRSVSQDASGGLWAAFNAAGLSYWNSNTVTDFGIGRGSNAWTVLVDQKQKVWAGTSSEGLFFFQKNHFSPAPGARILGREIFSLFESRDGRLWSGSRNGLGLWDGQTWRLFNTRDGLSDNSVRAIAEDATNNLWIGTENGGLDYFNGQKFTVYQVTNGLPGNDISCLYMDDDNVLWVGTAAHGLARFENGNFKCFSSAHDGLASDSISYIIGDDQGYLWIGSNRGLMRVLRKSLAGTNSFFCRVYGFADGLPTRECSSGSQPAALRARTGQLFFPTIEGLVSIDPSRLPTNSNPPKVLIESVLVDGQEQNTNFLNSAWSPSIFIPPSGEQLEINYTALNFSAPDAVRFKYRLEGHAWTDADKSRVARYPDLPPGNYHFQVIACNEDGKWNNIGARMDVFVLPQFWQTRAFQFAVILLALAVIVGIVRYVSTQKLHRQVQFLKQREALEHERARIARDLHDQLGANLTQVALLGEMAEADKNLPDEVESHTRQISQTARETTRSLDEIVWAINPSNDTLEGLANYVCKYAQEYLALANLSCRVDVPAQLPAAAIPPEVRHNVYLAFKEAVHNVIKHAQASEVWIRLRLRPNQFTVQVQDNGRGLGDRQASHRNGLHNMKKRMEDIGGGFSISSGANGGTLVELTVPLKL